MAVSNHASCLVAPFRRPRDSTALLNATLFGPRYQPLSLPFMGAVLVGFQLRMLTFGDGAEIGRWGGWEDRATVQC